MAAKRKKKAKKKATKRKAAKRKATKRKATRRKGTKRRVAKKKKKATKRKAAKRKATKRKAKKKKATKRKAAKRKVTKKKKPAKKKAKIKTKRKPNPAFMRPLQPDAALSAVVGSNPIPRTEVTKQLWVYIRKNGLQDSVDRRMINADDKLRAVFDGRSQVSMFGMTKHVAGHLK